MMAAKASPSTAAVMRRYEPADHPRIAAICANVCELDRAATGRRRRLAGVARNRHTRSSRCCCWHCTADGGSDTLAYAIQREYASKAAATVLVSHPEGRPQDVLGVGECTSCTLVLFMQRASAGIHLWNNTHDLQPLACLVPCPCPVCAEERGAASYLFGLRVAEEARGNGLATQLLVSAGWQRMAASSWRLLHAWQVDGVHVATHAVRGTRPRCRCCAHRRTCVTWRRGPPTSSTC
jgi:hypothetical protein